MSNAAPAKLCRTCGKDVSALKRVKDAAGRYQCEPCMQAAAASVDDTYDLLPAQSAPKPARTQTARPAPAATSPAESAGKRSASTPAALPKFCPNCDAPVLPNRKLCIKCNRDLTRMDKLIAMKAEAAKGPGKEEKVAIWISRGIKSALITAVVAIVLFSAIGLWTMLHPAGPFDEFPTRRTQTVSEFFGDIARGTDAGYEKAFYLVSFRERTTNNTSEIDNYKRLFASVNDALIKKHGAGWLSKMKVTNAVPAAEPGEAAEALVTIDDSVYHVITQVEISLDQVIANRAARMQPTYFENGKNHFAIVEIEEFPLQTKHKEGVMFDPAK